MIKAVKIERYNTMVKPFVQKWKIAHDRHGYEKTEYVGEENSEEDIQGGAEPTDTFQMVIGNIWIQGKICETVYKYVQVCYLLPTDYKLIF